MSTFERGIVKFFDSRAEKRFGFILLPSGEEVFFHFNDGAPVEVGVDGPTINTRLRNREPNKGDALLFERSKNRKGAKAAPWCFAEDWELAEQEIATRQVFRLVRQSGGFRLHRNPVVVWEGHNLEVLRQMFGRIQLGLRHLPGTDEWEEYWFEEKVAEAETEEGEWRELDNDRDPRQIPRVEQVRVVKPSMPFAVAKKELTTSNRNFWRNIENSSMWWTGGGKAVAEIDNGSKERIIMTETGQYVSTAFGGREAQELMNLGIPIGHGDGGEFDRIYDNCFDDVYYTSW